MTNFNATLLQDEKRYSDMKTKKIYKIIASSRYGKEEIDTAETLQQAKYLVNEYRLAYGSEFTIYIK